MNNLPPHPNPLTEPPFVGRQALYAQLQRYVLDDRARKAVLITAATSVGKSALLWHFDRMFDDTIIGVYFALDVADYDEITWIQRLIKRTQAALAAQNFNLDRLQVAPPRSEEDGASISWRDWLRNHYLSDALRIIRPQRRLVWLLDDADYLYKGLPADHIEYLGQLLQQHPQLRIVMTIHQQHTDHLTAFEPLVDAAQVQALAYLYPSETADLMRTFAPGASDDLVEVAHRLTGGHPALAQQFGQALYDRWRDAVQMPSAALLEYARNLSYAGSDTMLREIWHQLDGSEQRVLVALAQLHYEDTLQAMSADTIEHWLINTDYPTDLTTIHAALRSLTYRDLVVMRPEKINMRIGLFQSWLLEHARLDVTHQPLAPANDLRLAARLMLGIIVVAICVLVVFFALFSSTVNPLQTPEIPATVTLSGS